MWFSKKEVEAIHNTMDMSPISQSIEQIKSDSTIWNEYFGFLISRESDLSATSISNLAQVADLMLEEYTRRYE